MAPYNYNNFYDPVGSQVNQQQPQGYTYSTNNNPPSSTAQYPNQSSYQTSYGANNSYNTQYGSQAYGTAPSQPQPQSPSNSSRAASALTALTPQDYSTTSRASTNPTPQYNSSTWNDPQQSCNTNNPTYNQSSRSQANQSPLYQTSSAATFGRLSLPEQSQTQSSSNTFGNSQSHSTAAASNASTESYQNAPSSAASQHRQYMTAYTQQQNTQIPPDRYASPLHAVQAQQRQQSHNRQTSRKSNPQPSPQTAARNLHRHNHIQQHQNQRQQSASVEPSPTTVDPSQVYDFRAEQERKARIDAERRRKIEAEKAARKAEEDARQKIEDNRAAAEAARIAELERVESERRKAEEDAKAAEEAAATQQQRAREKKNEQRRKAREEKRQSKTAATALQQMASGAGSGSTAGSVGGAGAGARSANGASSNDGQAASMAMMAAMMGDRSQPPANDEEAEMRAMFAKMREFNAKNPTLLAKMWEEERSAHAVTPAQPASQAVAPPPPPATAKRGAGKAQQARQQPKTASAPANAPSTQSYQPSTGVNNAPNSGKAPAKASAPSQQPAGNASLWPPHKKGSLAEAAAKWLASRPENANTGFTINREQVLNILDTNPSYVQLCEMIEKTGVKFERSALAKELLKAVPDGLRNPTSGAPSAASLSNGMTAQMSAAAGPRKRGPNKPKSNYSIPNQGGRPSTNGTVSYQSPSFPSLTDAARAINEMSTAPTYPTNSLASALGEGAVQSPINGQYSDQPMNIDDDYQGVNDSTPAPVDVKPEEPPRPPADKEEAARKRTFGDLVDLTGGDDSDDEGPPRKMLQSQRPGSVPLPNAIFDPLQRAQQSVQQKFGTQQIGKPVPYDQFMRPNGYGRPTPLPSASATPAPPPQVLKSKGPTQEQIQHERMRGKMLVEPIMRDRVARKSKYDVRTIARDVLLATGRHPDMRALNSHMNTMQKLLGDHGGVVDGAGNKSDLSTIKWQFIDPGEPAEEAKAKNEAAKNKIDKSDASEEADDESEKPSRYFTPNETGLSSTNHIDKSGAAQMRGATPNEHFIEPKKKRGRPKGFRPAFAKKKNADQSAAADAAVSSSKPTNNATSVTSPNIDTTSPTRTHRKRRTDSISTPARGSPANKDNSPNMSSGGAVGYAAFREVDENGNVIKKKGRPVGWRKNVHSREAQGLTPAKAGAKPLGSKLRQSTTAAGGTTPTAQPPRREYAVYACEWKGCKSELDGLERLKKHILKIHGAANDDGDFECLWEGCKNGGKHVDGKGKVRDGVGDGGVGTFEDIEQWLGHVDKVHLESVGWKLGDGMRGEAYTPNPDLYLSDSTGRSLTPLIQPPPDPTTTILPPQQQTSQWGIIPSGRSKEELEAGRELEKLREKKVEEGGLLGKQGCRLANSKRRRGFLDDEDFWDVCSDESD